MKKNNSLASANILADSKPNRVSPCLKMLILLWMCIGVIPLKGQISGSAIITTIAGSTLGFAGDGSPASSALFNAPAYMVSDAAGNVYVSDVFNYRIRKINTTGIISTIAGNGINGFSGDGGPATAAHISEVTGLAIYGSNLFFSDELNHRIRRIDASGIITTIAGNGSPGFTGDGIQATASELYFPGGITFDNSGNLYVADGDNFRVRKINTSGIISTVAGNGIYGFSGDGGPATGAKLDYASDVAIDTSGNLYIADYFNCRIRKVNTSGIMSTYAGNGAETSTGDGGPATGASFFLPGSLIFDQAGNLYVSELNQSNITGLGDRIRKISPSGIVTPVAGIYPVGGPPVFSGDGGPAMLATLYDPSRVCFNNAGDLLFADDGFNRIRKISHLYHCPSFLMKLNNTQTICENSSAFSVNSMLAVYDTGSGNTLTWSLINTPVHGSASVAYVTTSDNLTRTPTGLAYTPSTGYIGNDSFQVMVTDGTESDTIMLYFTMAVPPGAIAGPTSICKSSSATLSDTSSGGAWSSGSTSILTVGSTGVINGISAGTATITYNTGTGCNATSVITVNPLPAAITGYKPVCPGSTDTLSDITSGGTWSSGTPGVATTGSGTGIVTGVTSGPDIISYTLVTGCSSTLPLTVNPAPAAITGPSSFCQGSTVTLSDATPGGLWSSSNTSVAGIGSATGIIPPWNSGTVTMSYSTGNISGCIATLLIAIHPIPATITGSTPFCTGNTITLSDIVASFIWSSSAPGIATISSSSSTTGLVTGISAGTATITYASSYGCYATTTVTVVTAPSSISGASLVCMPNTDTLSNTVSGGTWTSSATGVAIVGSSTGIVTGVSSGSARITYSNPSGCYVTKSITVSAAPSSITGPASLYIGTTATLSDATAGGVWSSGSPGIATIGSGTGLVTAITPGLTTMTYLLGTGCSATTTLSVGSYTSLTSSCVPMIYHLAGTLPPGYTGDGGPASTAKFAQPISVATDNSGNIYITDEFRLRKINTAGVISTIAGIAGGSGYSGDGGPATAATIGAFFNIASDKFGNIFLSQGNAIRKIDVTGIINTIAGSGTAGFSGDGGPATAATFNVTGGIVCDTSGAIIVEDVNNYRIRKIDLSGIVTTIAGNGTNAISGDGGPATAAEVSNLQSIACDRQNNLYYADYGRIRKISPSGIISTIAGTAYIGYTGDGGPGTAADIDNLNGSIAVDPAGNVFISDQEDNSVIRKIDTSGIISTYAGNDSFALIAAYSYGTGCTVGDGGPATDAPIVWTSGLATDASGNLYLTIDAGDGNELKVITPGISQINGSLSVCTGATTTLTNLTTGGTWSSSNTAVATVGTSSGVVTGVAGGTATITYSLATGCSTVAVVTVIAAPGAITGIAAICTAATTTLGDATTGGTWTSGTTGVATVGSASGVVTGVSAGTATITYSTGISCSATQIVTVNTAPASITGTDTLCAGSTATLSDGTTGGTWSSGSTSVATIGSATGVLTGVSAGTTNITYTAGGCATTTTVTIDALPASVTGTATVCAGLTATLSDATTGGTWTSGATGVATIGASSGIVTGISAGTTNITYTTSSGCTANTTVTVNALPASITGSAAMCAGSTTTLSDGTSGGTWSSSATGIATVGSGTGVVTGVSAGTATITYTLGSGCYATDVVTVNALPATITGTTSIFLADTSTLSDATGGGTWSSSNTGVATVGSSSGIVTGVSGGSAIITYTLSTGCYTTITVTVAGVPAPISGFASVCQSATITLSDPSAGGHWSSSNTGVATIGSSSGVVTGVAAGTATMTYTVSGSNTTVLVTVTGIPGSIAGGATSVCAGSTLTFSDAPAGGAWSSSATAVATIGSGTGVLTGVSAGTLTITYNTGCGTAATKALTVNPTPSAGTITSPGGSCPGAITSLTDGAGGGVWSSSSPIAAIGSSSGSVTASGYGTAIISYTVSNSYGCSSMATSPFIIDGIPHYLYTCVGTGVASSTGDGGPAVLANLQGLRAIATDTAGNLYISDVTVNKIRKVGVNGIITTVAGSGTAGNTGDGGQATAASLNMTGGGGVCVDKAGNIIISNTAGQTLRKVNAATGIITTICGTAGTSGFTGDGGPASAALIFGPIGVCTDTSGNIYFTDANNYRIRRIDAVTGHISTIIGTGSNAYSGDGGPGISARVSVPRDVAADKFGNLYIADNGNDVIRKYVISTGIITTIAGSGVAGGTGDGGQATAAKLNAPSRVATDGANNLYIVDQTNNRIREVNLSTGIISTAIFTGTAGFTGDGGPATAGEVNFPCGIAVNRNGDIYVSDGNNHRIRVSPYNAGVYITLAGPTTVTSGTPVTFTASSSVQNGVSYQWKVNGSTITGATNRTYTDASPANGNIYTCVLNLSPECGSSYNVTSNSITITLAGMREADTASEKPVLSFTGTASLYPNPVHESLTVVASDLDNGAAIIRIYDELGKVVTERPVTVTNGHLMEQMDVHQLPDAVYLIGVSDASGKMVRIKFVKD